MSKGFPSCKIGSHENSVVDIVSRGLDLLDLRLFDRKDQEFDKIERKWYHNIQKKSESESSGRTSYASSSNSAILLKTKEIAKLFHPDKKVRRHSSSKGKTNEICNKCNHVSEHSNMKAPKTSATKHLDDHNNENKWIPRGVKSPTSKCRDGSNLDVGDLTDFSSSSKLSNNFILNQKKCLSRKSTKFSKSRKRSTMSVVKEGKFEFHSGDYFRCPTSLGTPDGSTWHNRGNTHGYKAVPETKVCHFPLVLPNNHRSSIEELKDRSGPTLESLGIGKGDLDIKGVCSPQKKSIHDALYQRVAYFINPDISVIIDSYEFLCHKIVLQCYSEYFEELKNHTEVVVDGVTKGAFIAIYNWMLAPGYEGLRFIQKNNILEVLIASKILVIKELENQCLAFIDSKEAFSEENAYLLFIDASRRQQTEIMELMVPRIQMFFLVLVSCVEFTALDVNDLCTLLQSNYIIVHCELEIFMSAVKWMMAKWEERVKLLPTVMKCIRFGLMTPAQLVDIRKNPMSPEFMEITNDKTVQMLIEDGLAYSVEAGLSGRTDHHTQRCELLKLNIPEPRNWAKKNKDYKSYGEFLSYLDEVSKDPQLFYSEMKNYNGPNETNSFANGTYNDSSSSDETYISKLDRITLKVNNPGSKKPSLSNLLCKEQNKQNSKNSVVKNETTDQKRSGKLNKLVEEKHLRECRPLVDNPHIYTVKPSRDMLNKKFTKEKKCLPTTEPKRRMSLKEGAAIVIQSTFRGYAARKRLRAGMENNVKDHKPQRKLNFDNMFLRVKQCSDQDITTDDDLPQVLQKGRRKLKSRITLKRSSSTESNESIISVKEGPACRKLSAVPFSRTKNILLLGGVNPTSKHPSGHQACQVYKYSLETNAWDKMESMPYPRYYHGSASLKGKVYIVGGCNPENEDNNIPSLCKDNFSFEPLTGVWTKEPELITPRRSFGLVAFCNHLFAIGGQDKNDTILSSVERFDPVRNTWEEVAPLPEPSIGAAICVYKNLIWVAGGMSGSTTNVNVSKEVWCYDPRQDLWIKKPALRFGRAFAALTTYDDYLFLVGGVTSESGGIVSNDHIDVWDGENMVWKLKGNIDLPRHGHSAVFIGSLMMLMGGVTTKNVKGLNQVDSLCMVTGSRSKQIAPLPSPLVGHSCVLLPPTID